MDKDKNHEPIENEIAHRGAAIYLLSAFGAALAFFQASSLGNFPWVGRIGGTVWVGLQSLIISMPVVTSRVKNIIKNVDSHG